MCLNKLNDVRDKMSFEGKNNDNESFMVELKDSDCEDGILITSSANSLQSEVRSYCRVSDCWSNYRVIDHIKTHRGTIMEMVFHTHWGTACYMNGDIQSCLFDEKLYHQTLVHPAMVYNPLPRRVMIIGGGEGATAREVLKWSSVEHVGMYEWDKDVVAYFQNNGKEWGGNAWTDPRLTIYYDDIFEVVKEGNYPTIPYDTIIIDLFEPEDDERSWLLFTRLASNWLSEHGSIVMYAGIRNPSDDIHPAERWLDPSRIQHYQMNRLEMDNIISSRDIYSYKVFIPSFQNEACFLMLTHKNNTQNWQLITSSEIKSHFTPDIWVSYHTWNQYKDMSLFSYQC